MSNHTTPLQELHNALNTAYAMQAASAKLVQDAELELARVTGVSKVYNELIKRVK